MVYAPTSDGRVAQRGEHYVDIVGVTGSIPVTPTIQFLKAFRETGRPFSLGDMTNPSAHIDFIHITPV